MVDQQLVETLVQKGLELAASAGGELERSCWMVVAWTPRRETNGIRHPRDR